MSAFDLLTENVTSLVKEHNHRLRDEHDPDAPDINELVTAMMLSTKYLVQSGIDDGFTITSFIVTYMRTAYGLGFNRGYGKENDDG